MVKRGCALAFCLCPAAREPTDVFAGVVVVGDDVCSVIRQRDSGSGRSVGGDGESDASG